MSENEIAEKLEAFSELLTQVLGKKPDVRLVSFFQSVILRNRGELNPSEADFEKSRIIAFGMAMGFRFARKNPEISEEALSSLVGEGLEKFAKRTVH